MISRGYNHYTPYNVSINTSTHAEVDAINKLPSICKICKIDIFVIRTDKKGNLCYSKPCENCIIYMKKKLNKRNYYVNKIYYSISNYNIECMSL